MPRTGEGSPAIWIGLSDRFRETNVDNEFVWSQCEATGFTYFDSQEPNAWVGEDCVELDYVRLGDDDNNGHWNDLGCDAVRPVVCERGS